MIFYQRNISNKLLALRCISIVLGFFCYHSFATNKVNVGYVLAIVLILLCLIIVEDFIVLPGSFQVKKIYFFGFLPVTWTFAKTEQPFLISYSRDFHVEAEPSENTYPETGLGCLLFIYAIFGKKNSITHIKFTIKRNIKSNVFNRVDIMLSAEEYLLIEGRTQRLPNST